MTNEILERKENPFFNREEIKVIADAEKNPSFVEAEEIIASEGKTEKEKVLVKKIKGKFGRDTFLITAEIYKSKEDRDAAKNKGGKKGEEAALPTKAPVAVPAK